ncbi:MAG: TlyA family RNA methyltransferase [Acidimicrobiia bacterium]
MSRGGRKLDGALTAWDLDIEGWRAVDVGASTGGFTDCLLQRGVDHVVAVDVGYGQIHSRLRSDPRVTVIERTNIRTANTEALGAPFDLIVADLSFISLRYLVDVFDRLGSLDALWILLIKPQFEAGRESVGKGGVVRDVDVRRSTVESVIEAFDRQGLGCQRLDVSSITGANGNVEFVAMFTRAERAVDDDAIAAVATATTMEEGATK